MIDPFLQLTTVKLDINQPRPGVLVNRRFRTMIFFENNVDAFDFANRCREYRNIFANGTRNEVIDYFSGTLNRAAIIMGRTVYRIHYVNSEYIALKALLDTYAFPPSVLLPVMPFNVYQNRIFDALKWFIYDNEAPVKYND